MTPSRLPSRTTICWMPSCQPPERIRRSPLARSRAHIISSAQLSSAVEALEPPPGVLLIGMPRSVAALSSRLEARAPVRTMTLRLGRFPMTARGREGLEAGGGAVPLHAPAGGGGARAAHRAGARRLAPFDMLGASFLAA